MRQLRQPATVHNQEVLIIHPITNETWDVAPLLDLMQEQGSNNPALLAEAIYDIVHYVTSEQHSPSDTAARLRLIVRRLNSLAAAVDSIRIVSPPREHAGIMRIS